MIVSREIWRRVIDWPYMVSDAGRVMHSRTFIHPSQFRCGHKTYLRTNLAHEDGRKRQVSVHRLVCEAFHGESPSPAHQVAHWDGVPGNNHAENLRWASPKENAADKERHGTTRRGETNGASKITEAVARQILASTLPHNTLAKLIGVSRTQIRSIRAGKHWRHLGVEPALPCRSPR